MCQFKGHLIIVCCHAVYLPSLEPSMDNETVSPKNPLEEANWQLESFQRSNPSGKLGEHFTFIQHIQVGKELLKLGVNSHVDTVLMFSGGATKHTKMEESRSYLNALKDLEDQEGALAIPQENFLLETNATDSFQNLLFSILRYWSAKGSWPANITVITHAFKARRFLELHAPAIKWPTDRIRVVGIDPSFSGSFTFPRHSLPSLIRGSLGIKRNPGTRACARLRTVDH